MEFKTPKLEDKKMFDAYFDKINYRSADFSAATLILWKDHYHMTYAITEDMLIIRSKDGEGCTFSYPIGGGDEKKAVEAVMEYCREEGIPFAMHGILKETEEKMKEMFGDIFTVEYDRDLFDYIYERESLATLRGKKLHGKRNHINKFLANHPDYEYRKLDATLIDDCMALYDKWISEREETKELEDERKSVSLALHNMERLGLTGGSIFVDGKMGAFTVGERLRDDVQLVHIEKADTDIDGLYPMINQQYVLHECQDVTYVNREEDMGHAGMRKAKRSYNPTYMVEKYLLSFRDLSEEKGLWGAENEDAE